MNKSSFSLLAVGSLVFAGTAGADYTGLSISEGVDSAYGTTYHIYANMADGDRLDAVYGDGDNALTIDGSFYQNAFGDNTSAGINPALIAVFPSLAFDSWVTIGLEDMTGNALANIGIDWTGFMGGGGISTADGAWYVTPDDAQGDAVGGQVLIAQLTVNDGNSPTGFVNLQGKLADGSSWSAVNQTWVPAPSVLALLGLAGLAGRRRRH